MNARQFAQAWKENGKPIHWTTVNNHVKRGKEAFEKRFPSAKLRFKMKKIADIEFEDVN